MFEINEEKLEFRYSRSGGPGGQNVNKVNTRVTVFFDAAGSESLTEGEKRLILKKLATRANKDGVIRVVCQRHRTQKANKAGAVERLRELLEEALKRRKVRRATRRPGWANRKRLEEKKKRGMLKKQRSDNSFEF